jgi:hypothetical protein
MLRVKSPQDLGAGIVFLTIGGAGLYYGSDLAFGSSARMGPGYFPTLLSLLIMALGLTVGARGMTIAGPPVERIAFRPLVLIIAAILVFGFLIDLVGLALAALALVALAACARTEVRLGETALLGAGLALFAVLVFVYLLGQPLPAWWGR